MNSTQLNVKIDPKTKKAAQRAAEELGFSLSRIIVAYLKEFGRTKTVYFSTGAEEPSDYLIKSLQKSEEEYKKGDYYGFDSPKDALGFIDKIIKEKQKKLKNKKKAKK
jgi:antitoxin component of RelBE/YafQ-DinJ toxin-antitoxin module